MKRKILVIAGCIAALLILAYLLMSIDVFEAQGTATPRGYASPTNWPPTASYDIEATYYARIKELGFYQQPPQYLEKDGTRYLNAQCYCGLGTLPANIGAMKCEANAVAKIIQGSMSTPNPAYAPSCPGTAYAYVYGQVVYEKYYLATATATATPTRTVTASPSATKTSTSVPEPLQCVRVIWDKGTFDAGLNLRPGPSMFNEANYRSFLGPGLVFEPLQVVTNWQGTFAEFGRGWWIAMDLSWNSNVYAEVVQCP